MTADRIAQLAERLNRTYPLNSAPETLLAWGADALKQAMGAGLACVQLTAFNPEDVILSEYLARVKGGVPALFLDTGKHFPETLRYARETAERYGFDRLLTVLRPDPEKIAALDADGTMWSANVNRCCHLRKTAPLEKALEGYGYDVLLTGLRREQTPERADMLPVQTDDAGRLKISPLFSLDKATRDAYMHERSLPFHSFYALGYPSMGCAPCTTPVFPGEPERAGRWRHTRLSGAGGKTECGLHAGGK